MAILKNARLWFPKLDPLRPNAAFSKANPTWDLQLRTSSLEQKKEWEVLKLRPKLIVGKPGSDEEGVPLLDEKGKKQWRVNLKKKSIKADGTPADPVRVINGALEDIDPRTIGNDSIGNVRIFQYEYQANASMDIKAGTAAVLMAVQLTKHVLYVPTKGPGEDFEQTDTETIAATMADEENTEDAF